MEWALKMFEKSIDFELYFIDSESLNNKREYSLIYINIIYNRISNSLILQLFGVYIIL